MAKNIVCRGSLLLIIAAVLLAGCTDAPINIKFYPSATLNTNQRQQSLSVIVRLYQLRDKAAFVHATFWELWKNDKATLKNSLLSQHEVILTPGVSRKVTLPRDSNARYLGIVAVFRHPDSQGWRLIRKLPRAKPLLAVTLHVSVIQNKLQFSKGLRSS